MRRDRPVEWLRQQSRLARRLSQAQLDSDLQRRLVALAEEYHAEAENRATFVQSDTASESKAS
jgi:hypothetical protein